MRRPKQQSGCVEVGDKVLVITTFRTRGRGSPVSRRDPLSQPLSSFGGSIPEKSPSSRTCSATLAIALTATQVNEAPTLIRWAPASAISFIDSFGRARTLIGLPVTSAIALIWSVVRSAGA